MLSRTGLSATLRAVSVSSPPSLVPVVLGRSPYRTGAVHPHAGPAALSRDAQTLWLASWRGLASLATCDGLTRRVWPDAPTAGELAPSADGDSLFLANFQGIARWSPSRGLRSTLVWHVTHLTRLVASPTDPGLVAVSSGSGATPLVLARLPDGGGSDLRRVALPVAPETQAFPVCFSPDGDEVIVVAPDRVVRVGVARGEVRGEVHLGAGDLTAGAFVSGTEVVVATARGTILCVDLADDALPTEHPLTDEPIVGLWANGDARRLVALTARRIVVVDVEGMVTRASHAPEGFDGARARALLAADAAWIADPRGVFHTVSLADREATLRTPSGQCFAMAFDGDHLAVARLLSPLERYDLRDGSVHFGPTIGHWRAVFSADGRSLLRFEGQTTSLYRLRDGTSEGPFAFYGVADGLADDGTYWHAGPDSLRSSDGRSHAWGDLGQPRTLAVSPSGRRALAANGEEVALFDLTEGRMVARWPARSPVAMSLYSDTEAVLLAADGLRWVEAETGATSARAKDARGASLAVSRDGAVVATCSVLGVELRGRDQPSAPVALPVGDHPTCAAFSSDGARVAVGCLWSEVFLFDVAAALATRPAKKRR